MIINGMEKLSLVDYDGLTACTLFTGGCNFRCPFCHNSPLVYEKNLPVIGEEEIFEFLKKRAKLLDGVVITGGEPTINADLPLFIAKIKTLGYKVKLDTNGTNPEMLKKLVHSRLIDYAAMDIKNCKEKYAETAGLPQIDLNAVEKSVEILLKDEIDYEFRTTLVEEFHTESDMKKIGEWICGAKKYVLQKFTERETCINLGYNEIEKEKALKFKDLLEGNIKNVELRGY